MSAQVVVNPATGEEVRRYDVMPPTEVARIVELVHDEFEGWCRKTFQHRSDLMLSAASVLREDADEYARLMALEMGKPIREGRAEAEKCAWVCEYYAENAESFLAREIVETDARTSFVTFRPLGVVLSVMPWNFPFWQVFRFAAPTLMAGNTCVLKHASNVPGCALAIEDVFRRAGFPQHAFRSLVIGSDQVSAVVEHPLVRATTLTGSEAAGASVGAASGRAIKPSVLELGGSDPFVILADADLDAAAEQGARSRLINGGQSCIAAKRFVVVDAVCDEWLDRFVAEMTAPRVGDPLDEDTDIGPMARVDIRDELRDQTNRTLESGAACVLGGQVPERPGAWYPPTVLTGVRPGSPGYDEELFGPVAAVIRVEDEAEAIRVANDTSFGLGAAIFTRDIARGERIAAEELDAGCCFVNSFVRSDPRLPFGGIKASGYGRELARFGILAFVNIKTVYVA